MTQRHGQFTLGPKLIVFILLLGIIALLIISFGTDIPQRAGDIIKNIMGVAGNNATDAIQGATGGSGG
ncbi:MAG: hypothetical protein SVU32_00210 [Candidatus Nanohaloarchaea archaeon]|nr:hypothetical protein [Candidatus Nanohaloarchaea archaeon]